MKIKMMPIESVIPYARNPRKNDDAVAHVAASIKEFGVRQPIVVDDENVVICGHTRLKACQHLGLKKVPVHVAEGLTKEQIKAYRIADNRSGERAEWDYELLSLELSELDAADYDIELTGFSMDDIPGEDDKETDEDAEPQIDRAEELNEKWKVKTGDLWLIGDHRLLCGDSTNAKDVARVMGDRKPVLMVTDPPYGVEYNADWRNHALRADGSPSNGRAIGKVSNDDRADWREAWTLFPGDVAYVWHAGNMAHVVAESLIACDLSIRSQIVWAKSQLVIGRGDYHPQHEPCWYCVRKGKPGFRTEDRKQTTLWQIDKPQKSETGHSTQKPIECMARPMRNHHATEVYDPFLGSGTTMVAAQNLNRKCYGIEISPNYCAVILERMITAFPNIDIVKS